jgi:hypothetical protein
MSAQTPRDHEDGPDRSAEEDRRSGHDRRLEDSVTPESDSESERRDHRRHAVANLRVKGPVAGDVINTSHLGMAIQTNESLTIGWSYAFRMRNGPEVIRIPGKVRWCRLVQLMRIGENEFLPVFRMGVEMAGNLWGKPQVYYYP